MFVQLGAFSADENADAFLRKMRIDLRWLANSMQLYRGDGLYKVHAGPYANREEAEHRRRTDPAGSRIQALCA